MISSSRTRWLIDIALGGGLVVAIIVIYSLEPRTRKANNETTVEVASTKPASRPPILRPDEKPAPSKVEPPARKQEPNPTEPRQRIPVQEFNLNEPRIPVRPAVNEAPTAVENPENTEDPPFKPEEKQAEFLGVKARGRRFCIIADNSGSMFGRDIRALREELLKTVDGLEKGGEYYIICFNDEMEPMPHLSWLTTSAPETARIRTWITNIESKGGTNPRSAINAAFQLNPPPDIIYFMTDGMIPDDVPEQVERLNRGHPKVAVHTILFGNGMFSDGGELNLPMFGGQ